jgi:hypothetical protein
MARLIVCVSSLIAWALSAFILTLAVFVAPAVARSPVVTDPGANSPAGVVYSIPLDSARQDAAPNRRSGTVTSAGGSLHSGGGGGGGVGGSPAVGGTAGSPAAGSVGGSSSGPLTSVGSGLAGAAAGLAATRTPADRSLGTPSRTPEPEVGLAGRTPMARGQSGSLVHSGNGFGSSSSVPGLDSASGSPVGAVQSGASGPPLAILLLAVGVFVGAGAWRAAGHGRRKPRLTEPPSSSS